MKWLDPQDIIDKVVRQLSRKYHIVHHSTKNCVKLFNSDFSLFRVDLFFTKNLASLIFLFINRGSSLMNMKIWGARFLLRNKPTLNDKPDFWIWHTFWLSDKQCDIHVTPALLPIYYLIGPSHFILLYFALLLFRINFQCDYSVPSFTFLFSLNFPFTSVSC